MSVLTIYFMSVPAVIVSTRILMNQLSERPVRFVVDSRFTVVVRWENFTESITHFQFPMNGSIKISFLWV